MAINKVKVTYSLDVETTRALERTAKRWKVTKSEALTRAIRMAASENASPLQLLDALELATDEQHDVLADWAAAARSERHAGSRKREPR